MIKQIMMSVILSVTASIFAVQGADGRWGFMNDSGQVVVPMVFHEVRDFNQFGVAIVRAAEGYGIVNAAGNAHLPMLHYHISDFDDHARAIIGNGRHFGIVDPWGNMISPMIYDRILPFQNGFAQVTVGGQHGLVDLWGNLVVDATHTDNDIRILRTLLNIPYDQRPEAVEKAEWFSDLRQSLPRNTPIHVLDLLTGNTYYVASFSNGNHADVEPLTILDTLLLFESASGQSWNGRPVWIYVNGRTIAAAVHSMPHDVSTINDNGMDGHICLHFYGSITHNTRQPVYAREIEMAYRAFELMQLLP